MEWCAPLARPRPKARRRRAPLDFSQVAASELIRRRRSIAIPLCESTKRCSRCRRRRRGACASVSDSWRASARAACGRRRRSACRGIGRTRRRMRRTPRSFGLPAIETFARLLAELPLRDEIAQELRRLEARAERRREILRDAEADVEADEIGETQRSHRMVVAELHRAVDVFRAGDAFFEHANRLEPDRDAESRRGEAG